MDEDELATLLKKSKTAKTEDERILAASQYKAYKDSGKKTYDKLSRSEEHTSELQSRLHLVCRLLLEEKI